MRRRFGRGALVTFSVTACALLLVAVPGAQARGRGLHLDRIAKLRAPVSVTFAPSERRLVFVVGQSGQITVLRDGKPLSHPFLDLRSRVEYDEMEQGMYSIAFDPDYARNRRFYVYYINRDSDIEVDMFKRSRSNDARADPDSRRTVIVVPHPDDVYHNGGGLHFGPDGLLYVGTGGAVYDRFQPPDGNSQDPHVLLGKLLRIDPRSNGGYDIPTSNPFSEPDAEPEIYASGLRNPYRFSFDVPTDSIYIADVGQEKWEEIDRVSIDELAGANFGWYLFEGNHTYTGDGTEPPGYVSPVLEYSSSEGSGSCAVIGGLVVHDQTVPSLDGRYLYSDLCGGDLRSFNPSSPAATDRPAGPAVLLPTSIGSDARGHVYVTAEDGSIYRVKATK